MLLIQLLQIALLLVPVLGDAGKYYKMDFDIKKGSKLVDAVHDFVEGIADDFDLSKRDNDTHTMDLKNERAFYIAQVKVGTPGKDVKVLIDTGSADLWVMSTKNSYCSANGGDINCEQYGTYNEDDSSTFKKNDTVFNIQYLDQTFANGTWAQDTIEVTSDLVLKDANFAVAEQSDSNVGVFGIAYKALESTQQLYDNLPVQMKQQGFINKIAYSLYLTPAERNTGSVLFGGIDHAKYTGELVKFDIPPDQGENVYLQIPLTSMELKVNPESLPSSSSEVPTTLQSKTSSPSPHPTIAAAGKRQYDNGTSDKSNIIQTSNINALLDSGTTLTYFDQDIVDEFVEKLDPSASFNAQMGGYEVACTLRQPGNNVTFNFDNKKEIDVPLSDLIMIAGQDNQTGKPICMLGVAANSHTILGDNFLRHCYSVFDLEDDTISIAQMNWNDEEEDIETIE